MQEMCALAKRPRKFSQRVVFLRKVSNLPIDYGGGGGGEGVTGCNRSKHGTQSQVVALSPWRRKVNDTAEYARESARG